MRGETCSLSRSRLVVALGCWLTLVGLVALPPAAGAQATPPAAACPAPSPVATLVPGDGTGGSIPAATPAPAGLATPVVTDCLRVTLTIDKREAGPRVLTLTIKEPGGKPLTGATVTLRTWSLEMNHGISSYTAKMTKPGVYVASDVSLGMSGKWQVEVTIGRPGAGKAQADFIVSLTGPKM